MRTLGLFASLVVFWLLNSGQLTNWFLLLLGLICCLLTTWLGMRMQSFDRESNPLRYLPRTLAFLPWLAWQILLSNIDLARRVWSPKLDIQPRVTRVPCQLRSPWMVAAYANCITLTPGTVTMDVEPDGSQLLVHALSATSAGDLETGDMERRLQWVEAAGQTGKAVPS